MLVSITKDQLKAAAEVIMRVPGLFIIDYWYRYDRSLIFQQSMDRTHIFQVVTSNLVLLHGFLLLLLPLSHVKVLYTHFVSGCLVVSSHSLSSTYVTAERQGPMKDRSFSMLCVTVIAYHVFIVVMISHLISGPWKFFPFLLGCYVLPVIASLADLPFESVQLLHNFAYATTVFGVTFYIVHKIPKILEFAKLTYMSVLSIPNVHDFFFFPSVLWNKLFVPNHFVVFWLIEFFTKLLSAIYQNSETPNWGDKWYILVLRTVSLICVSPVSLAATSVSVSYISFFVLIVTRAFLIGQLNFYIDNPLNSGWTESVTFALLAIQTGLTETKMPDRTVVMTIILFIVLSSLLQSMLEITEPVVLALSASHSRNFYRHLRALILCLILLVFPLYLSCMLFEVFSIDIWIVVVLSSYVLTSVEVIDLLIIHCLFLYDSVQAEMWENLDDIVYYTRAVTKLLEFFVSVFVVGLCLWESLSYKWNYLNASILFAHCYFNVWQRMQVGWRSFLLRREAAKKSELLPSAIQEELQQLDDVCSICFSQMKSACITPCQHYFHRTCLRKWLYVQNNCPLCHRQISVPVPADANTHPHRD